MAKAARRRPMTLMVISPIADRIHMALMTGATAAAMGRPVTFFFSKGAVKFLSEENRTGIIASNTMPLATMDAMLDEKGIADSALLLDGLAAMEARFIACETAIREYDIDPATLITRPAIEIGGLAPIIEEGEGGDWLTF
ncbi:DsrE family protein [Kordiimonas marina]|uniref:DsrE family protein n=1 Tax=Kordiimonas marina TaxID=2872312 RepID=UPI001FF2EFE0|nr:DsrE family protein [Kordiimonas marina]MCJ9430003.1 DsrE family protein [Kordiimonas marina]